MQTQYTEKNARLSALLLPAALSLAAAMIIMALSGMEIKFMLLFCLMVAAILGLLIMNASGVLLPAIYTALGFALFINPRKYIGPADEKHFGGVPGIFISLLDLGLAVAVALQLFRGREMLPRQGLKKLAAFAAILAVYLFWMCLSFFKVQDVKFLAISQILFEMRSAVFFLLLASGFLFPGSPLRGNLHYLLAGFAAGVLVEAAIVCAEYLNVLPQGASVLGIQAGGFQEVLDIGAMNRVGGTFRHPNYLGAAMAMVLPVFTAAFLVQQGACKYLFGAATCGTATALVLTLSRGGFLSAGIAMAVFFSLCIATAKGRAVLRRNSGWLALSAVIVLAVIGAYAEPISMKLFKSSPVNVSSRADLNTMALQMITTNPLTGIGINNSTYGGRGYEFYEIYLTAFGLPPVVHNLYLLLTAEIGIPGAAAFLAFLVLLMSRAAGRLSTGGDESGLLMVAGLACGIVAYMVSDLFEAGLRKIEIAYLFWWSAGVLALLAHGPAEQPAPGGKGT